MIPYVNEYDTPPECKTLAETAKKVSEPPLNLWDCTAVSSAEPAPLPVLQPGLRITVRGKS